MPEQAATKCLWLSSHPVISIALCCLHERKLHRSIPMDLLITVGVTRGDMHAELFGRDILV